MFIDKVRHAANSGKVLTARLACGFARNARGSAIAASMLAGLAGFPNGIHAQEKSNAAQSSQDAGGEFVPLQTGDGVVTNFSGLKDSGYDAKGDESLAFAIDTNGASAVVLRLKASAAAKNAKALTPLILRTVTAAEVGQVFAVAIGNDQSVYLGATSYFGLNITKPAKSNAPGPRLRKGDANAQWMEGQFGPNGGPGSIWKIDGATGKVTLFTNIDDNSGPGIGGLAADPESGQVYAADLDSGLVYRFDETGKPVQLFDHGVDALTAAGESPVADDGQLADIKSESFNPEDPQTWGFTAPERRVTALSVHQQRLYYAVASPLAIWSVSLNKNGEFGGDFRKEIDVSSQFPSAITSIAFDSGGMMFAAQRGPLSPSFDFSSFSKSGQAQVFRFQRSGEEGPWTAVPKTYAAGRNPEYNLTGGGVDVGCSQADVAQDINSCESFVWTTIDGTVQSNDGSAQDVPTQHGLQGVEKALFRPQNVPPSQATFAVYDQPPPFEIEGFMGDIKSVHKAERVSNAAAVAPTEPVLLPRPKLRLPARFRAAGTLPPDAGEILNTEEDRQAVSLLTEPDPIYQVSSGYGEGVEEEFYAPVPLSSCECPIGEVGYLPFCHAPLFPIFIVYQREQFFRWSHVQITRKQFIIHNIINRNNEITKHQNKQSRMIDNLKTNLAKTTDPRSKSRLSREITAHEKLLHGLNTANSKLGHQTSALNKSLSAASSNKVPSGHWPTQNPNTGIRPIPNGSAAKPTPALTKLGKIREHQIQNGRASSSNHTGGGNVPRSLPAHERREAFAALKNDHAAKIRTLSQTPRSSELRRGSLSNSTSGRLHTLASPTPANRGPARSPSEWRRNSRVQAARPAHEFMRRRQRPTFQPQRSASSDRFRNLRRPSIQRQQPQHSAPRYRPAQQVQRSNRGRMTQYRPQHSQFRQPQFRPQVRQQFRPQPQFRPQQQFRPQFQPRLR